MSPATSPSSAATSFRVPGLLRDGHGETVGGHGETVRGHGETVREPCTTDTRRQDECEEQKAG